MLREVCRRLLATEDDPMDGSRPHLREVEIVPELDVRRRRVELTPHATLRRSACLGRMRRVRP